jgi:hypothetical protein
MATKKRAILAEYEKAKGQGLGRKDAGDKDTRE